jgi:hypothetical protein
MHNRAGKPPANKYIPPGVTKTKFKSMEGERTGTATFLLCFSCLFSQHDAFEAIVL